jgi:hypothetical protein
VKAGDYGRVLLRVVDKLCGELGDADVGAIPAARSRVGEKRGMARILSAEDELAVTNLGDGLAKIAAALSSSAEPSSPNAVQVALHAAEMVMRGELMNGSGNCLPDLMPSFVFLVALPIVDQDRALELSLRAAELIEQELED